MMTNKKQFYRQGDILFEKIDNNRILNDPDTNIIKIDDEERTVARGELTGHHHSFSKSEQVILFRDGGLSTDPTFVNVLQEQGATITHQEHAPITLEKGLYKITREREYNPFVGLIQRSSD